MLSATEVQYALTNAGWLAIVAGVTLAVWGVTIDGDHWWRRFWPEKPKKNGIEKINLDDAIRYIAHQSIFGKSKDKDSSKFSIWIGDSLESALVSGDIQARGRSYHALRGGVRNPPVYPLRQIPREFWVTHRLNSWWALNNQGQNINGRLVENAIPHNMHLHPSDKCYEGMHDIVLDKGRLETIWPKK